jgi:Zn-dependent metalloprotease
MDVRNDHDGTKVAEVSAKGEGGNRLYAELDEKRDDTLSLSRKATCPSRTGSADTESGYLPPYIVEELQKHGLVGSETVDRKPKAINSIEVDTTPDASGHGAREVYDAHFGYAQPGNKGRFEGEAATGVADVDNAYDLTGVVRDFYKKEFARDSIDGKGMKVVTTVNYGENFQNAMWDQNQMWYGHPNESSIFKTFILLDVTAHELTHGVTEKETGLWHWDQAGALHEHFSDVFGEMAEQYARHQTANEADWLHGAGVFKPGVNARAIRDMLNPGTAFDDPRIGKDPQPAHMKDYVKSTKDNGGVHINSGIPNRAFALFAKSVGGYSWEDPGQIWYAARKAAGSNPTFAQFAYQTIEQAKALGHADEVEKLQKAWDAVGVVPSAKVQPGQLIPEDNSAVVKKAG